MHLGEREEWGEYGKSPTYKGALFPEHVHKSIRVGLGTQLAATISYIVLYCDRFIILFIQIVHRKETNTIKKTLKNVQYRALKSTVV